MHSAKKYRSPQDSLRWHQWHPFCTLVPLWSSWVQSLGLLVVVVLLREIQVQSTRLELSGVGPQERVDVKQAAVVQPWQAREQHVEMCFHVVVVASLVVAKRQCIVSVSLVVIVFKKWQPRWKSQLSSSTTNIIINTNYFGSDVSIDGGCDGICGVNARFFNGKPDPFIFLS